MKQDKLAGSRHTHYGFLWITINYLLDYNILQYVLVLSYDNFTITIFLHQYLLNVPPRIPPEDSQVSLSTPGLFHTLHIYTEPYHHTYVALSIDPGTRASTGKSPHANRTKYIFLEVHSEAA